MLEKSDPYPSCMKDCIGTPEGKLYTYQHQVKAYGFDCSMEYSLNDLLDA